MQRLYVTSDEFQKVDEKVMKPQHFKLICRRLLRFGTTVCTSTFIPTFCIATAVPIAIAQSFPPSGFPSHSPLKISPLDGIWKLQWQMNGYSLDGLLTLAGSYGTMTVNVRYSNSHIDIVQQTMVVKSAGDRFIIFGQNPVYSGTNIPIVSYIPDTFLIEQASNLEGWNAKSCDSTERCSQVRMQYVSPAYPEYVPNIIPTP
ncbi:hypothetical protein H6G97_41995 [Nostoc flagelliforme FACHB-838]|uniref:Uncharacterized protein n=1 Tax=Nostoc flagelliforme FACHB-838 TaxID=2692904 RepID=A0ABR8E4U6_9NOSO|nr:hypothetical protein [Nostoc flagelliforme]MBD2535603.1 hypothetical protein [Nostoc flagelliforme FACHB-838]